MDAEKLKKDWETNPRWKGIKRNYRAEEVAEISGTKQFGYPRSIHLANCFWELLQNEQYVPALGALNGLQALQMAKAGLKAIYVSGWQAAAGHNLAGEMYPDQSIYPSISVPILAEEINNTLQRADEIDHLEGKLKVSYLDIPCIADAEAGFGGLPNVFELMKAMIKAGTAGVHFEDQLSAEKKCGHMGGKVLVPTGEFIKTLNNARLAADRMEVPTVLIARTDANSAMLINSDADEYDHQFLTGERVGKFFRLHGGLETAIARGLAYAPYADLLWCETANPNLEEAKKFAEAIHASFPGKMLAYNCSPSFNWKKNLDDKTIAGFQKELGKLGYKFQFITLAGFHSLCLHMFKLAKNYGEQGMTAYTELQQEEFQMAEQGYTAHKHQREVGTGYFDRVSEIASGGTNDTAALKDSTEKEQF